MKIQLKKMSKESVAPFKAHKTDAGFDIFTDEDVVILPGETKMFGTGVAINIPNGWEGEIRGRSGLNSKTRLLVANGTIDAGYQGEVKLIVNNLNIGEHNGDVVDVTDKQDMAANFNNHHTAYLMPRGSRVAQLLFHKVYDIELVEVDEFTDTTERGVNGFGSTGI